MARWDDGSRYDSGVRYDEPDNQTLGHMRNLPKFLEVPFDDKGISEAELLSFTTDFIERATAQSPVALAARITATNAALQIVAQCSSDDTVKLGARKAAKEVKNLFRENLPDQINAIWLVVAAEYGMNAPQLTEVFPKGRSVFGKGGKGVTDDKLQIELDALVVALTAKQADLGAQVVTDATALKTNWASIYDASEEKSGQKSMTESGKRTARLNLQLELYFDLIELMKMFPRQPEKLALYMTQSLLEDHPAQPEPAPAPGP
jgi:hypothetical protein